MPLPLVALPHVPQGARGASAVFCFVFLTSLLEYNCLTMVC